MITRRIPTRRTPTLESLEDRLCLATSVGWDGPGQGSANLTYYIANAPSSLGAAAVEAALETALNVWASVADITFTQTSTPNLPDSIDFTFGRIDGRNGTLAYGYFPDDVNPAQIAGDIKFDSSERWEVGNGLGSAAFDLVRTAVHEIGHALGLDHSSVPGSVLADTISPNASFTGLTASDVGAIRSLYAAADSPTTPSTTPTTPTMTIPTEADTTPTTPTVPSPRFRGFPRFWWGRFGGIPA